MGNIWHYAITVFMGFFAIMNPIVNIPIFIKLTDGLDTEKKKQIARTATLVAFIIVTAFILIGKYIFEIFGLTIPAFKVFGGILIFFIGFEMLQSKKSSIKNHEVEPFDEGIAISPMAIPILAGPGTIVTAMNFVAHANWFQLLVTIFIFALFIFLTYQAFSYSGYIVRLLGEKNFVVIGKLMGIILGVLGADMLLEGVHLAFDI
ncbi:MAG: MarC family protein [Imperialibacter sp.]|uniref:MarC family protein n=1 Tax=Imperialibacter sp. TaxID=2038411 RepID=UPI0032EC66AE